MKSYTAAIGLAAFVSTVAGHGYIKSPTARSPGDAMQAACGQQVFNMFSSDINGNVQTALQIASSQSDFDAAACDIWLCKGMKYEDNTANVQSYTAGQEVPIVVNIAAPHTGTANVSIVKASTDTMVGSILKSWTDYASTATGVTEDETNFSITMPTDLGDECATAGDCVIQWWWDARSIDQTYESCIDFTMGGSGSGSGSAPAASSSAASTSAPAATPSASATATPTVAQNVQTSTATTPTASVATSTPSQGSDSGSTLPENFTVKQFITWLKEMTGTSNARRAARRHARAFL